MAEVVTACRHIPNVITAARILATPVLVYLAMTGREDLYTWLLLAAFLSDIADGLIARILSLVSDLGSRLDSLGDTLLAAAAMYGIWVFHPELLTEYWTIISPLVAIWIVELLVAFRRYGRATSFHTYLNRASAYVLGIFVVSMFFWGIQPLLLFAGIAISTLAIAERLILIALLPEWTANVRGVYWILNQQKVESA